MVGSGTNPVGKRFPDPPRPLGTPGKPAPLPPLRIEVNHGDVEINRLAVALAAFDQMDKAERERALLYLKSKYAAEWPSDQSY